MPRHVRFDEFEIELDTGDLSRGGQPVKLQAQPARLLSLLVRHAGAIVTRAQIQNELWPDGTVVNYDESIRFSIKRVREVLTRPELIETVPRRGYRFRGEVEEVAAPSAARRLGLAVTAAAIVAAVASFLALSGGDSPRSSYAPRPLTFLPGEEKAPALSPDGTRVAFEKDGRIYLQLVDDAQPVELTEGIKPIWSPDGTRLLFLRHFAGSPDDHFFLMSSLGGEALPLGIEVDVDEHVVDWSPDGTQIAFGEQTSVAGEDVLVMMYSLETGEKKAFARGTKPAFSPDGRKLAYQDRARGTHVLVQALDETEPSMEYVAGGILFDLDWTPDGSAILVGGFPDGILRIDARTGEATTTGIGSGYMTWNLSAAGARLVYTAAKENYNLWELAGPRPDARADDSRPFLETTIPEWGPRYSPDGAYVAFASPRAGGNDIWVCGRESTGCRQVTRNGGANPVWSPDGEHIAFARGRTPDSETFVVASTGGVSTRVALDGNSLPSEWLTDGSILLHRRRGHAWSLWRMWTETGRLERLLDDSLEARLSSNERVLYSLKSNGSLWMREVDASGPGQQIPLPSKAFRLRWDVWQDMLVYQSRQDEQDILMFYDLRRLETVETKELGYKIALGMSIAPDGARIMVPRRFLESDLWIVDDFF